MEDGFKKVLLEMIDEFGIVEAGSLISGESDDAIIDRAVEKICEVAHAYSDGCI